jgi:hypothetical protein
MITRRRCLVTVAICGVGLCVSLSALNGAAGRVTTGGKVTNYT